MYKQIWVVPSTIDEGDVLWKKSCSSQTAFARLWSSGLLRQATPSLVRQTGGGTQPKRRSDSSARLATSSGVKSRKRWPSTVSGMVPGNSLTTEVNGRKSSFLGNFSSLPIFSESVTSSDALLSLFLLCCLMFYILYL